MCALFFCLNLEKKIKLAHGKIPGISIEKNFDAIISKDLLHHLPKPLLFWEEVKKLSTKGVIIFVMDLIRPTSKKIARDIVERTSAGEPELLKEDFYNSLLASFTLDEINEQIKSVNLNFT